MAEGLSRRSFIKLAATASVAALPGCEPAARKLIPYVVPDDNVIPGVPAFYATVCAECSAGCGVVARVREGRVVKLEGNPVDPISQGALCARGQAALQGLYNPDRLGAPMLRRKDGTLEAVSWDKALGLLDERLQAAAKKGANRVAYFGSRQGPTLDKLARLWLSAWGSNRLIAYEALNDEAERAAAKACFGRTDLPVYRIDQAEALVSFGADFLETWGSPVEYARQYAAFRAPRPLHGGTVVGRSAYVGPRLSMTAAKCDQWVAARPGTEGLVALGVLNVLVNQGWLPHDSGVDLEALRGLVGMYTPAAIAGRCGVEAKAIVRLGELFGQAHSAVALAGTDDPTAHIGALILNTVTGNLGRTVVFTDAGPPPPPTTGRAEVEAQVAAMKAAEVDVVVVAGANPIYAMPASAGVAEALARVPLVVWMGQVPDETAAYAGLLLPIDHPLESWHDVMPRAGNYGLGQPVMQRVFPTMALGDLLIRSARAGGLGPKELPWQDASQAVAASWQELRARYQPSQSADDFWTSVRRHGGLFLQPGTAGVKLDPAVLKTAPNLPEPAELVLAAFAHPFFFDGRGADKPWLQEIPEPVTQVVWNSWAEIHPETARQLGLTGRASQLWLSAEVDVLEIASSQGRVELPVYIAQTVRPGVIAAPLGQGHSAYGRYARGRGANLFQLLPAGALSVAVKARPTGKKQRLVSPLGKSEMMGRALVEAISVEELARGVAPRPEAPEAPEPHEFYAPFKYPVHQWGMTIDVNACTGCSACVAACYAENNVPVVGEEGVERGRIMSWIRIERFFPAQEKAGHAPLLYLMPMLCQQCDHAPCEPVCPVFAAVHTEEGLNGQIYNRCVGTRYCENNCPYKVRRFNWFAPQWPAPLDLQLNPDVTVRGAGVMEKCTFCFQRIRHAEITAKLENRPVRDGEIVPACAQSCPSKAISFGDMNEPQSAMMRRRADHRLRNYAALAELNTRPAITYLRAVYHGKGKA